MSDLQKLTKQINKFRKERNWEQFHNPKDMALSLVLEATELMEHFQWKNGEDLTNYIKKNKKEISYELADTLYWVLTIAHDFNIDIVKSFTEKMKINAKKYPVSKFKGRAGKYNEV